MNELQNEIKKIEDDSKRIREIKDEITEIMNGLEV